MDGAEASACSATAAPVANAPLRWSPTLLVRMSMLFHGAAAVTFLLFPSHWAGVVLALLANHLLLTALGLWPKSHMAGANLVRLPEAAVRRHEVSLTFDDGPDPQVTPQVLDLLDRCGAKASFFLVAQRAAAYPALVRDIVRRGHSIENHSYSHSHVFACYGLGKLRREVETSQALVAKLTGRVPRFFRAPMGLRSPLLDPVLARAGLRHVAWTRRGYDTVSSDAGKVLRRLTRGLSAGDVLLLHDGNCARAPNGTAVTLAVLPKLLEAISAQGLRSVSVPMAFERL
jgi:peptidoglycan/xylan/chitin deacetylase (PgdA/CDA1 family)